MQTHRFTYGQSVKKRIRHTIISNAVLSLTQERENTACVRRSYVREIYDYFTKMDEESPSKSEAEKIDNRYIIGWENLHDTYTSKKNVNELVVCYLCGPEPDNDFQEFIDLGVLPQNIWAFEMDKRTYDVAVSSYEKGEYPQPRILKQNVESFFRLTPKKFDIVYIDACGGVPSKQHSLRVITTLCLNSRLNSPGAIITNFSSPDTETENDYMKEWQELIATYLFFKRYPSVSFQIIDGKIKCNEYDRLNNEVDSNFNYYYGEFISALLRDIPSIIVPIQRIKSNQYIMQFVKNSNDYNSLLKINEAAVGNSLARFFLYIDSVKSSIQGTKLEALLSEFLNYQDIIDGFKFLIGLQSGILEAKDDIKIIRDFFEVQFGFYQFLDKPHSNLVFDAILNQLVYPMHYNFEKCRRFTYKAKEREMFTDVSFYDECRYVYEWIPAIHQIKSAFENPSWQYVFRFAIDGLIKNRINYNNEYFFQGSVVRHDQGEFKSCEIAERETIYS